MSRAGGSFLRADNRQGSQWVDAAREKCGNRAGMLYELAVADRGLLGLPEFDGIAFRVVEAGEPAVGIRLGVDLDLDASGLELGGHFLEIADAKVEHPDFAEIAEIGAGLLECSESGRSCFLMPGGFFGARWNDQNTEVLLIPEAQCFWIFGAKEEASDSGDFFHLRCTSGGIVSSSACGRKSRLWLRGCLHGDAELVAVQEEARAESEG
jgi:hypothetical protein